MNYYNEFDPHAAAWLRELINLNLIPSGDVDTRSIKDVSPSDLHGYTQCHFFAGIGGWSLALRLAGWPDDQPVWTGSCPCQPFSVAGKGLGTDDERHLWPVFRDLIAECRPSKVFGEQVASKAGREWLAGVFADLEGVAYAVAGADLCSAGEGAPHIRQRLYWVADSGSQRCARERVLLRTEAAGRNAGSLLEASGGGATRRLADAPSGGLGIDGSASRDAGHVDECGEVEPIGMGNASSAGTGRNTGAALGAEAESGREGDSDGMHGGNESFASGDARRLEHSNGPAQERFGSIGLSLESEQEAGRPGNATPWANFEVIGCADGKARRIEPGTFPLVDGLPRGVVYSRDSGVPINPQATGEARVMRLRGYGNAINPYNAATFIQAAREALEA